jgi:hypothetical protein
MNSAPNNKAAAVVSEAQMDRRIIRVELPPAHAGVTAALRKAFSAVPAGAEDRQFDELLARLG